MKFQPKTDKQLQEENLLAEGTYEAVVLEAEDQVSKKGQEMLKVKFGIDEGGRSYHVYTYLSPHFMHFLFKHFFESAGKLDVYEKGGVSAEDIIRYRVLAFVTIEEKEGYETKNTIRDFFTPNEVEGPIGGRGSVETVKVVESMSDLPF